MLYCSTDRLSRRGAPVKNLSHSASLHSRENIAPSKPGIKHLAELDAAIARDPGDSWSYAYKSWALTSDGRHIEALSSIDEAIRRDPNAPPFFIYLRGAAAYGLGRFDEAEKLLTTVGQLSPDDQWAQLVLIPTYLRLGRAQDAWSAAARFNHLSVALGNFPISVNLVQGGLGNGKMGYQVAGVLRQANFPENSSAWLPGADLRLLLIGHRIHGRTDNDAVEREASFSTDGTITMSGDWGSQTDGTAEIKGRAFGQVCPDWSSKHNICAMVFRTYNGSKARENEFTWVDSDGALPFSRID